MKNRTVSAAIVMALWALSAETRQGTRRVFAAQLSSQQRALLNLQQQNLRTLISSAAIISESPTLRSALETYRLEQNAGGAVRNDLVQTVERELANLVTAVDRQLLMVTDDTAQAVKLVLDCYERRCAHVDPHEPRKADAQ